MTPDPIMAHLEAAFALMVRHAPKPHHPSTPTTGRIPPDASFPQAMPVVGTPYSTSVGDSSDPALVFSSHEDTK